jgi:hypothetical protein
MTNKFILTTPAKAQLFGTGIPGNHDDRQAFGHILRDFKSVMEQTQAGKGHYDAEFIAGIDHQLVAN